MAYHILISRRRQKRKAERLRELRDKMDPFALDEDCFIEYFRLPKDLVLNIINLITPQMSESLRGHCVPHHLRILVTFFFYGNGFYTNAGSGRCVGRFPKSLVALMIQEVTDVLTLLKRKYVQLPKTTAEKDLNKEGFSRFGMTGIIGVLHGTHISIVKPCKSEKRYVNQSGHYSLNVQLICNHNKEIISFSQKHPGSISDMEVWTISKAYKTLKSNYERGDRNSFLLGDKVYQQLPWLLTPFPTLPTMDANQIEYNKNFSICLSIAEQTIGLLKGRFRCLLRSKTLHYQPIRAAKIILACAILHNIAIRNKCPDVPLGFDDTDLIG